MLHLPVSDESARTCSAALRSAQPCSAANMGGWLDGGGVKQAGGSEQLSGDAKEHPARQSNNKNISHEFPATIRTSPMSFRKQEQPYKTIAHNKY